MALIPCPECAANISEHAAACPHCGYPVASPPAGEEAVPIGDDPTRPYWQTAPPPPGAPPDEVPEGEAEEDAGPPINDPAQIGENLQRLLPAVFAAFLAAVLVYKGCEPPPPDPDAPAVIHGNSRVAETPEHMKAEMRRKMYESCEKDRPDPEKVRQCKEVADSFTK